MSFSNTGEQLLCTTSCCGCCKCSDEKVVDEYFDSRPSAKVFAMLPLVKCTIESSGIAPAGSVAYVKFVSDDSTPVGVHIVVIPVDEDGKVVKNDVATFAPESVCWSDDYLIVAENLCDGETVYRVEHRFVVTSVTEMKVADVILPEAGVEE